MNLTKELKKLFCHSPRQTAERLYAGTLPRLYTSAFSLLLTITACLGIQNKVNRLLNTILYLPRIDLVVAEGFNYHLINGLDNYPIIMEFTYSYRRVIRDSHNFPLEDWHCIKILAFPNILFKGYKFLGLSWIKLISI